MSEDNWKNYPFCRLSVGKDGDYCVYYSYPYIDIEEIEGAKMLVLLRKEQEKILIGNDIEIVVVEIRGDKVRLGIKAPDGVAVDREEVRIRKDQQKLQAIQKVYGDK